MNLPLTEYPTNDSGQFRIISELMASGGPLDDDAVSAAKPPRTKSGKKKKLVTQDDFSTESTNMIRMRPSSYNGIPSTVFFEYPTELCTKRNDLSTEEELGKRLLRFDTHWERNCIKKAFQRYIA